MSGYFSNEILEQVRHAADIVNVIGEHISLKKVGNSFQALCPFHSEKTPSFYVNPQRQIFKCFGCGKAGNVFHFLMEMGGISFPEAVKQLAARYNIALPQIVYGDSDEKARGELIQLMNWSVLFFQKQLNSANGQNAREYLKSRRFEPAMVEQFQLGFAPEEDGKLFRIAVEEGFSPKTLEKAGVIVHSQNNASSYHDLFRNRLMFPIWNGEGEPVGFGGRTLLESVKPKYLNSPETPLFSKRKILYGFHHARPALKTWQYLVVMEGYTDVIMAHQFHFNQTVATLGTSLSEEQTHLMRRYVGSVILLYDGDAAGQNAMIKVVSPFIKQGLMVRIAILPDNLDPYDLLLQKGAESFESLLKTAQDFLDFQLRKISEKYDLQTSSGRRYAIEFASQMIRQVPDPVTQKVLFTKVAEIFKLPPEFLFGQMPEKRITSQISANQIETYRQLLQRKEENFLLWAVLHYPGKMQEIFHYYAPENFQTPELGELAKQIASWDEETRASDIASLSTKVDPYLGQKLVDIAYGNETDNIAEETTVNKRLDLIFQGITRQQERNRVVKLKKILETTSPQDEALKYKILEDVRELCKTKIKRNFSVKSE